MSDVQFYIKKFCRRLLEVILLVPALSLNYLWWDIHEYPQSYEHAFVVPWYGYSALGNKSPRVAEKMKFDPNMGWKFRMQLLPELKKIMY